MPVGFMLVMPGDGEQGRFGPNLSRELDARGQAVLAEAVGNRNARLADEIAGRDDGDGVES